MCVIIISILLSKYIINIYLSIRLEEIRRKLRII